MCDAIGHPALRVVRTEFATIQLGELRPATYRYLDKAELARIYETARIKKTPPLSARAKSIGTMRQGKARRGKGTVPVG
jgi:hypothetical protein